jgi:zeta-carotene desaturase
MFAIMRRLPADTPENFLAWLRRHGQTERAIERFWKVVLVSALNEDLDRVSVYYAAQVFRESFLKSAAAGRMGVPAVPLGELYGAAADYIRSHGGEVLLRAPVDRLEAQGQSVRLIGAGRETVFDAAIAGVPFDALSRLLPAAPELSDIQVKLEQFKTSPITGIHLWFDRQITDLEHAVLLERTIQWMFHKSKLLEGREGGSYVELVVSSSKSLVERSRNQILELAQRELAEFFPEAKQAKVVKATVIKEVNATYSALPQSDAYRPGAATPWPRLFLAGDWTASGWPATMEGAVRSGYKAAEALLKSLGREERFLVPDLPARGLMRLFS